MVSVISDVVTGGEILELRSKLLETTKVMTIVNVQNEVDCVYRIGRVENIVHVGYLSSVFS